MSCTTKYIGWKNQDRIQTWVGKLGDHKEIHREDIEFPQTSCTSEVVFFRNDEKGTMYVQLKQYNGENIMVPTSLLKKSK